MLMISLPASVQPDIEAFLKWTGYQHVPGKSALFTPGNASTWPQVRRGARA